MSYTNDPQTPSSAGPSSISELVSFSLPLPSRPHSSKYGKPKSQHKAVKLLASNPNRLALTPATHIEPEWPQPTPSSSLNSLVSFRIHLLRVLHALPTQKTRLIQLLNRLDYATVTVLPGKLPQIPRGPIAPKVPLTRDRVRDWNAEVQPRNHLFGLQKRRVELLRKQAEEEEESEFDRYVRVMAAMRTQTSQREGLRKRMEELNKKRVGRRVVVDFGDDDEEGKGEGEKSVYEMEDEYGIDDERRKTGEDEEDWL